MRSRDACGCRAREAPCCVCAHVIEFAEVATRSHAGTETQSAESRPWRKPKQRTIAAPPRGTRRLAFYRMFGSDCCAVPTRRRASERRRESLTGTGRSGWAVTKLDRPAEHSLHSHARGTNAAQRARTPRRRTAGQRHGHPAPSALPSAPVSSSLRTSIASRRAGTTAATPSARRWTSIGARAVRPTRGRRRV
jgi:hypothetical protein